MQPFIAFGVDGLFEHDTRPESLERRRIVHEAMASRRSQWRRPRRRNRHREVTVVPPYGDVRA